MTKLIWLVLWWENFFSYRDVGLQYRIFLEKSDFSKIFYVECLLASLLQCYISVSLSLEYYTFPTSKAKFHNLRRAEKNEKLFPIYGQIVIKLCNCSFNIDLSLRFSMSNFLALFQNEFLQQVRIVSYLKWTKILFENWMVSPKLTLLIAIII